MHVKVEKIGIDHMNISPHNPYFRFQRHPLSLGDRLVSRNPGAEAAHQTLRGLPQRGGVGEGEEGAGGGAQEEAGGGGEVGGKDIKSPSVRVLLLYQQDPNRNRTNGYRD